MAAFIGTFRLSGFVETDLRKAFFDRRRITAAARGGPAA
jgi:hypothetical protein